MLQLLNYNTGPLFLLDVAACLPNLPFVTILVGAKPSFRHTPMLGH